MAPFPFALAPLVFFLSSQGPGIHRHRLPVPGDSSSLCGRGSRVLRSFPPAFGALSALPPAPLPFDPPPGGPFKLGVSLLSRRMRALSYPVQGATPLSFTSRSPVMCPFFFFFYFFELIVPIRFAIFKGPCLFSGRVSFREAVFLSICFLSRKAPGLYRDGTPPPPLPKANPYHCDPASGPGR